MAVLWDLRKLPPCAVMPAQCSSCCLWVVLHICIYTLAEIVTEGKPSLKRTTQVFSATEVLASPGVHAALTALLQDTPASHPFCSPTPWWFGGNFKTHLTLLVPVFRSAQHQLQPWFKSCCVTHVIKLRSQQNGAVLPWSCDHEA